MEVEDLGHHISKRFNEDLEHVRNSVLAMGGLVEEQLDRAIKALSEANSELGLQVAEDDIKVNRMEVSIDEECSRILATRAPTASDLRLVIATLKTITDLERIGDEAEKIGVLAARLASVERPSTNYRELSNLARHVKQHGARRVERVRAARHEGRARGREGRRRGRRGVRVDLPPGHHVHDGRSAHDLADHGFDVDGARARAHRRSREEHLRIRDLHGPRQGRPLHGHQEHRGGGRAGARGGRRPVLDRVARSTPLARTRRASRLSRR